MENDRKIGDVYYTPELSEFYIGFECESNYVLFVEGHKGNEWNKLILTKSNIAYMLDAYIQNAYTTEFRVKYLDKEDIESLGWEYYTHEGHNQKLSMCFKRPDESDLLWWIGSNHCELDCRPEYDMCYRGPIKNKSELIQLMKKLDI